MYINRKGLQFSRRDSFDHGSLTPIITEWLRNFKMHYSESEWAGVPNSIMCELFPETVEFSDDQLQVGTDKFISDIDEMIWAFEVDDMPDDCWLVEPDWSDDFHFGGGELDIDKIESHQNRKQAGIDLFAKRYQTLWW